MVHASPAAPQALASMPSACPQAGPYRPPAGESVGVPAGLPLCPTGPRTVRTPGAVLDGWDVRGGIVVDAPDVVVRRSRITGDGSTDYGVRTTPRGSVRVEDTTLTGAFGQAAIGADRWTAERVELTGLRGDGVHLGRDAVLRGSWLYGFTPGPGAHVDAVVLVARDGAALVEGNRVEMGTGPGHGSAVLLLPGVGGSGAREAAVIRGNILGGGDYTVRQLPGDAPEVLVAENRFGRDARLAPTHLPQTAVLRDNSFVDGGAIRGR